MERAVQVAGYAAEMSTSYHPESDGQTEVVNRCLETFLRCFIADQPKTWVHWIPWAEYWFNTTYHASTGQTPFEIVYGRPPPCYGTLGSRRNQGGSCSK